nr:MAG TPA: hypothetical protein [Bacteriophage sp.]
MKSLPQIDRKRSTERTLNESHHRCCKRRKCTW